MIPRAFDLSVLTNSLLIVGTPVTLGSFDVATQFSVAIICRLASALS